MARWAKLLPVASVGMAMLIGCSVYDAGLLVGGAAGAAASTGGVAGVGGDSRANAGGSGQSRGGRAGAAGSSFAQAGESGEGGDGSGASGGTKTTGGSSSTGGTRATGGRGGTGGKAGTSGTDTNGGAAGDGGGADAGGSSGSGGTAGGGGAAGSGAGTSGASGVGGSSGASGAAGNGASGMAGSSGGGGETCPGCARLSVPLAATTDRTHFVLYFGSNLDLSLATLVLRVRVQSGTGGRVQAYVQHGGTPDYNLIYGGGRELTALTDWTDISWDVGASTSGFDHTNIRRIGIEVLGGTSSAWSDPTILYVDSIALSGVTPSVPAFTFDDETTVSSGASPTDGVLWMALGDDLVPGSALSWLGD